MLPRFRRVSDLTLVVISKRHVRTRRVIGRKPFVEDLASDESTKKNVMILGSNGAVGSSIVQTLKREHFRVIEVDISAPHQLREQKMYIQLPSNSSLSDMIQRLREATKLYSNDENNPLILDAIICANGGFSMDGENPDDIGSIFEDMMRKNFYPIVAAGEIAKEHMTVDNGLFVAIGAMDALNGSTPGMSAYGCSKVAAHHYIQTLGSVTGETLSGQGKDKRKSNTAIQMLVKHAYLKQLTALAILPTIIDTPSNRNAMPLADFNQWSKPLDIAKEISSWLKMPVLRPHSGSMIKIVCKKGLDGQYRSEFQLVR